MGLPIPSDIDHSVKEPERAPWFPQELKSATTISETGLQHPANRTRKDIRSRVGVTEMNNSYLMSV